MYMIFGEYTPQAKVTLKVDEGQHLKTVLIGFAGKPLPLKALAFLHRGRGFSNIHNMDRVKVNREVTVMAYLTKFASRSAL